MAYFILIVILQIACNILILEIVVIKVHKEHMNESHGYDIGKPYIRAEVYSQMGGIVIVVTIVVHIITALIRLIL